MLALKAKLSLVQNLAQDIDCDYFFADFTLERQHNRKKQQKQKQGQHQKFKKVLLSKISEHRNQVAYQHTDESKSC